MFSSVGGFRFVQGGLNSGIYIFTGIQTVYQTQVDSANHVIITGDDGGSNSNIVTSKMTFSSTYEYSRQLSGTSTNEYPQNMVLDASNNIYIVGGTTANSVGNMDMYVSKYNTSGSLQWQKTIGTSSTDLFYDIEIVDSDANLIVTGYTANSGLSGSYIGKLSSSSGNLLTQIQIGGTGSAPDITKDNQGNVYVLADEPASAGRDGFVIQKLDTSLNDLLVKRVDHATTDIDGTSIAVDSSRNIYFGCITGTGSNMFFGKLNSSGVLQWQKTFNYTWNNGIISMCVDNSGYVYLLGTLGTTKVVQVIKMDSTGAIVWQRGLNGYGGTGNTTGLNITWKNGFLYISGFCQYPSTDHGMLIVVNDNGGTVGTLADGFVWGFGPFTVSTSTDLSVTTTTANHSDPGLSATNGTLTDSSTTVTDTVISGI